MGNKMCKKKVDSVDNPKSPSPFDRIITRLHLKPNSWKSDSHLHTKQVNRYEINPKDQKNGMLSHSMSKSKSSDWTEAELEVPEKEEAIHLKNPQLSFIFNDNSTPTPPPRKHKKSIREKIETVAKNSMQALQSKKCDDSKKLENESKKPVEEVLCVKRVINYGCPCGDPDYCNHRNEKQDVSKNNQKRAEKEAKRKKNLSVVSLPNYNELKFSVANSENSNLKYIDSSVSNSANSLPGETKKSPPVPPGKLENYMTRCRSFGSLLNNKLRVSKEPTDVESDDSFGGLEEWDLGILEHYNPKDASLPRPRKPVHDANIISDIEQLIVPEEEIEVPAPVRPVRRSESLIKRMSQEAEEAPIRRSVDNSANQNDYDAKKEALVSRAPPPTPQVQTEEDMPLITKFPMQDEDGPVEHSSLMRILQEYSVKDAQKRNGEESPIIDTCQEQVSEKMHMNRVQNNTNIPPTKPPYRRERVSLNENTIGNVTSDFINTERVC